MNRQIFKYLAVAAIALSAALTSCKKDNDNVKLLETMTYLSDSYNKYEYDSQKRIAKLSRYLDNGALWVAFTYTYSGAELTKMTSSNWSCEFVKDGNKITVKEFDDTYTLDLNSDGLPEKYVKGNDVYTYVENFQYKNGNLVKKTWKRTWNDGENIGEEEGGKEYKYDNNKSPLYYCKTPKWFLIWDSTTMGSLNNVTDEISGTWIIINKYEYDSEGFPTKQTASNGAGIEYKYTEL